MGQLIIIERTVSRPVLALTFVLLTHFDYWLPQNVAIDARTYGAPQYGHATTRTTNYAMATKCGCHWVTSRSARHQPPHPRRRHPAATPLLAFPPRRKCNIEMKSKLIRVLGPSLMNCQWVSSLVRRGVPAGGEGGLLWMGVASQLVCISRAKRHFVEGKQLSQHPDRLPTLCCCTPFPPLRGVTCAFA